MINATTLFIIGLFLLIASAVLVGELFTHIGQAPLVGQLLVGVLLGPTLLGPALGLASVTPEFSGLETLATFFILLIAGLSISPQQLRSTGVPSALLGMAMFFIPFAGGAGLVRLLYPTWGGYEDLFVSLTISITALPVLGVMLQEFGLLETPFGVFLLNASVVNELCAVTVFATLLEMSTSGVPGWIAAGTAVGSVLLFLGTVLAVYFLLRFLVSRPATWNRLKEGFRRTWNSREASFALLIVAALGSALYSQYLGLTFVVGAFYAGFLITPEVTGKTAHRSITTVLDTVGWGFFIPLFFVLVGYDTNFRSLGFSTATLVAFAGLVAYAVVSKFIVGSGISLALGRTPNESFLSGFLVTSRGAVASAMAVILLSAGVFNTTVFTIVAGVTLITTIIAPIGARPFVRTVLSSWHRDRQEKEAPAEEKPVYPIPAARSRSRPRLPEPPR